MTQNPYLLKSDIPNIINRKESSSDNVFKSLLNFIKNNPGNLSDKSLTLVNIQIMLDHLHRLERNEVGDDTKSVTGKRTLPKDTTEIGGTKRQRTGDERNSLFDQFDAKS